MPSRPYFLLLSLFLAYYSSVAGACGEAGAVDTAKTEVLLKDIESKFDLRAVKVEYRCGGSDVLFMYKPSLRIGGDRYPSWNESFRLGGIPVGRDMIKKLQELLKTSVEKIEQLKMAQSWITQEHIKIEEDFGVEVSTWPSGTKDGRSILEVSMPVCKEYKAAFSPEIAQILSPVSTIEGLLDAPDAVLYQAGDLMKALKASSEFMKALNEVTIDNIAAETYMQDRQQMPSHCSTYYQGNEKFHRDWNLTRLEFGLDK